MIALWLFLAIGFLCSLTLIVVFTLDFVRLDREDRTLDQTAVRLGMEAHRVNGRSTKCATAVECRGANSRRR